MTPLDPKPLRTLAMPEVAEEIERVGGADLVIGIATAGVTPTAAAVAAAARAGLQGGLADHTAVFVHVDPTPSEETSRQVAEALAGLPLIQLHASGKAQSTGETPEGDDSVRTVLEVGRRLSARAILLMDVTLSTPSPDATAALATPVLEKDHALVVPFFHRGRHEGTLTHALVVPLVRALYGRRLTYPLAQPFACSGATATRLLEQDVWGTELARQGLEFWIPVSVVAEGLLVGQTSLGRRVVPPARPAPLGPTVGRVAGALFALAQRYETAWLDVRDSEAVPTTGREPEILEGDGAPDPERMVAGFRLGVRDLLPVWERILAPENLAEVLDLSDAGTEDFRLPDRLWARVVYDFLLGYRFRVVYRTHLVQSLAPLYLGRAASVVLETRGRPPLAVAEAVERLGRQFELEKAYLVERWQ